ncbi:MAG TPA: DoxX family membrane protein, partial [Solirubrobacteraceae bacterium]
MTTSAGVILLVGRVLFAVFFANSAYGHFKNHAMMTGYAKQSGVPVPVVAGWPAGTWLAAATVSVAAGIWADLGALMIAAFVIPAAWFLHPFWGVEDPAQRQTQLQSFLRNVTFLGAGLALFALFASIDHGLRFAVTGSLI